MLGRSGHAVTWSPLRRLDLPALRRRYPFAGLVRPHVGLIPDVLFPPQQFGAPPFAIATASLGNLTRVFPHIVSRDGTDVPGEVVGVGGGDVDPELAWVRAIVEGAERYASMVHVPEDFVVASARELGDEAIDLSELPRCSDAEYADPRCPLRPADPTAPMRWVRGYSLVRGQERLVPAILVQLHLAPWPSERFWLPISTGVAAHSSLAAALVNAFCEMIERDSLALAWLLRRPLPRIELPDPPPESLAPFLERLGKAHAAHHFFDATTDLGIPTVLAVQYCKGHPTCELFVGCATALEPAAAYAGAIREVSRARSVMSQERAVPSEVADFCELTHGADYYGRGGHSSDFDFLLGHQESRPLEAMGLASLADPQVSDAQKLNFLAGRLDALGMEAIALDLTTEELRDVGLWAVRVVIPRLVPISCVYRARYLGTPRIMEFAASGRREATTDVEINPGPLPFA
jgi:ribosomal protein S12 methylthiotransferase accessory factor